MTSGFIQDVNVDQAFFDAVILIVQFDVEWRQHGRDQQQMKAKGCSLCHFYKPKHDP